MLQHALDDAIGAASMLGDLFQIAGQHPDRLIDFGALVLAECGNSRGGDLLQFVEQFDREVGEIVDEVERVLDLVSNPRSQLAYRGHLLSLDQTGLGGFKIAMGGFGRIASRSDLGLRSLALGDVAVNHHNAAIRHRVILNFDHCAVRAGSLKAVSIADPYPQALDLRLGIGLVKLPGLVSKSCCSSRNSSGNWKSSWKLRFQAARCNASSNRDTINRVVEGDLQLLLVLADFAEPPRMVLNTAQPSARHETIKLRLLLAADAVPR